MRSPAFFCPSLVAIWISAIGLASPVSTDSNISDGFYDSSGGGTNVGNGGGLAEGRIAYSYLVFEQYLRLCKANTLCATDPEEASYLDILASDTRLERKTIKPRFKSEKADPGFFMVNGVEQSFRTSPISGSDVWFNLDKIYITESNGVVKSLSTEHLFELVATALATHVPGPLPHERAAALLRRLSAVQCKNVFEAHANAIAHAPKFGAIGFADREATGTIFSVAISDFTSAFNQTDAVLNGIMNAIAASNPKPQIVKRSRILQAAWKTPTFHFKTIDATFELKGLIETESTDGSQTSFRCQLRYESTFQANGDGMDPDYFLDIDRSRWVINCD